MTAHPHLQQSAIPAAVAALLKTLHEAGFSAYPVGGCVRDLLLGRQPHDWDVTTNALPRQSEELLQSCRVIETGVQHGTITVLAGDCPVELTTFRGEGGYVDGRHPDTVTFGVTLQQDLSRRDFTIGAMAWDTEKNCLIDPFGGQRDLQNRLLRAVGDPDCRFAEDGLRILRGLRFAAELGFAVEPVLRWAALLHDAEKPACCTVDAEGIRHFHGHQQKSAETAEAMLRRLHCETRLIADVTELIKIHDIRFPATVETATRWAGRWGEKRFLQFTELRRADTLGQAHPWEAELYYRALRAAYDEAKRQNACFTVRQLAVSGDDLTGLGLSGPAVGEALRRLLRLVQGGTLPNERAALLAAAGQQE